MNWDNVQQLIRKALSFGAGLLVTKGVLDADMATAAAGAVATLIDVGWWFYWNHARRA
jgi:hypothetical protein